MVRSLNWVTSRIFHSEVLSGEGRSPWLIFVFASLEIPIRLSISESTFPVTALNLLHRHGKRCEMGLVIRDRRVLSLRPLRASVGLAVMDNTRVSNSEFVIAFPGPNGVYRKAGAAVRHTVILFRCSGRVCP